MSPPHSRRDDDELTDLALHTVQLLQSLDQRLVLAESCTAGLISASLGRIAGVSSYLCGSAVVYREQTKMEWLHVHRNTIQTYSAESVETTREMSRQVLEQTTEATVSLAVTGHLGPQAPPAQDGFIYWAIARRIPTGTSSDDSPFPVSDWTSSTTRLVSDDRVSRQIEAVVVCLRMLSDHLASLGRSRPKPR